MDDKERKKYLQEARLQPKENHSQNSNAPFISPSVQNELTTNYHQSISRKEMGKHEMKITKSKKTERKEKSRKRTGRISNG